MRTFLHHFREHHTTEARHLWNNPDVFGDGPEEQPQSSERQEITDATNPPEGVRVRIETAEEMETSVQEEALKRMGSADTESKKEEDLQTKLNREIGILLESIKGLSSSEQGARVREFNEKFLHPLGHHLYLIDGNARISAYMPEDPRMAIYRAKIAELTAEISRTTTAINQARIHGIAPMAREYRGFKRGMIRRGNIAPEIQRFMMQFPAAGASALAPDLKKMYEHLAKKQMELAQLKQAGWQSLAMPVAPRVADADTPLREESPARFQRRVPVDRMEFSRGIDMLDPETRVNIQSLSPAFQQAIGSIATSFDEQGKKDLGTLTEKLASGNFNAKVSAPIFNPDGTLRAPQEIRAEIAEHPGEAKILEDIATFIESLSPNERKIMELIIKKARQLQQDIDGKTMSSAEQIQKYKEQWEKAKTAGDEASMEIAEGLLLMQGMEIDDKGKLTPLEEGFGGKGMGFIMGLIMVVDGFLKKIGEKMERKKKKEEKKNEAPIAEMTDEQKKGEITKSEKRIEELQKEQKDLQGKIKKGEEDLAKEPPETKHVLQMKLEDLRKELKKVEEEMKKEEARLKTLKEPTSPASAETKSDINVLMEKAKKAIEKSFQEMKQKYEAEIKKMPNVPKDIADSMMQFMEIMKKMITVQKNDKQECRYFFDINSAEREMKTNPQLQSFVMNQSDIQKIQEEMQKKTKIEWMTEGKNLVSAWVSADVLERTI